MLLQRQEKLQKKVTANDKRKMEQENRVYERDGDIVYVSGFESHVTQQEVQEFIEKHGKLVQFDFLSGKNQSEKTGGR